MKRHDKTFKEAAALKEVDQVESSEVATGAGGEDGGAEVATGVEGEEEGEEY